MLKHIHHNTHTYNDSSHTYAQIRTHMHTTIPIRTQRCSHAHTHTHTHILAQGECGTACVPTLVPSPQMKMWGTVPQMEFCECSELKMWTISIHDFCGFFMKNEHFMYELVKSFTFGAHTTHLSKQKPYATEKNIRV